ncbi:hypothetical protein J4410_06545 [Candidatus Woesearchaeota archaeon]|nr:hypothetical protein [Candidatus Woesearchaeota archaeon]
MTANFLKGISIFCILWIIIIMTLFFAGVISGWWFWGSVVVCAIIAYRVLPKIKKE